MCVINCVSCCPRLHRVNVYAPGAPSGLEQSSQAFKLNELKTHSCDVTSIAPLSTTEG